MATAAATTQQIIIENLLNEFYDSNTQNWRKHEIEKKLINYKQDLNSWKDSILQLNNFNKNQFLWFFNSSTIEFLIIRNWHQLTESEHIYIRENIWQSYVNLIDNNTTIGNDLIAPKRQRDTIAQLIVLIGKREFPDKHPFFIQHILELIANNFLLGINLLRITSEEVVSVREDLPCERKKYFQSCVSLCMPEIFNILEKSLVIIVNHLNGTNLNGYVELINSQLLATLPNDNRLELKTNELLTTIQHLFSWVTLEDLMSEYFLLSVLYLARCDNKCSSIALQTLNELFYVQRAIPLQNILINGIKELLSQPKLGKSNELYQDKFTELLRLFTIKYSSKLVADQETFPSFIYSLYNYTFIGNGALSFTEKLEIWAPIIKCMTQSCYNEILKLLVGGILNKIQIRYDKDGELECLDNETLDDNMETEWQHYLTMCIETLALVAEGRSYNVFEQVLSDFQKLFEIFASLEKGFDDKSLADQSKSNLIHSILRDLSSLCQALVRLTPILENCEDKSPEKMVQMTNYLIYAVKFLTTKKFQNFSDELSDLFAQILSAIRSLLWLPIWKTDSDVLKEIIESVASVLLPSPNQESKVVLLAAGQLLLSITSILRPSFTLECPSIIQLIQAGRVLTHLNKQLIIIVHEMILNCLVLPWNNINNSQQDFERRSRIAQEYILCITQDFLNFDVSPQFSDEPKLIAIILSVLPMLKEINDYYKEASTNVKQILVNAFKPVINKSLEIYSSNYGIRSNEISANISDFCLSVLRTYQIQMGNNYIREILTIFIQSATKEQLSAQTMNSIYKILEMLQLVVQQPGNSTLQMIPSILNLALDHVLPLISNDKASNDFSDISLPLYNLLNDVMYHRWQYFYKSHVRGGFSPGASEDIPIDGFPQHSNELLAILTAFGRALINDGNDPHVRRVILISLQNLNERWKLFHRDFFKDHLLSSFQCALINLLLSNEGALHYDLLINVLFLMGQVNISKLHESFITIGFDLESNLVKDICLATDLPTFLCKMNQLVQDTRCHSRQ